MNTLADLERITGAKRRSIQLWAEAGAIKSENECHGGRGAHRHFSEEETRIASVLAIIALSQFAVGELTKFASAMRGNLAGVESGQLVCFDRQPDGGYAFRNRDAAYIMGDMAIFLVMP